MGSQVAGQDGGLRLALNEGPPGALIPANMKGGHGSEKGEKVLRYWRAV